VTGSVRTLLCRTSTGISARSDDFQEVSGLPPRGVRKNSKRARQYEHIKESEQERGVSADRAEEIAARTVNKERARSGESSRRSRKS
jgi:hypothetical protein